MLRELIYLTVGATKKLDKIVEGFIEEGKKEVEDKGLVDIGKEHLSKRKEQIKNIVGDDIKKLADELGLATKEDIEEIKTLLRGKKKEG
ncbi:hypothetical protein [Hippea maritima]|uniref:Uncharacterized protein n=1 Tax=Hippea maritima (strain ATCC 700847 / DSM 10411 / MH2) TaxID=760142 RepID=F2LXW4_HIPMA|nr:hypothetical protein [Hippea maritima]AEA33229.1 hypothetical protein Hipma_0252 [Hippea maritima DSM 10411]